MSKKRIYEYAKEVNVKSKEIIDELKKMDVEVSNHMQALEDDQIKMLNKKFKSSKMKKIKNKTLKIITKNSKIKKIIIKTNLIQRKNNKNSKNNKNNKNNKKVRITNLLLNPKKCLQKSRTRKVLQ